MPDQVRISPLRFLRGIVFNVGIYILLLFAPAGTIHWWRGWVLIAAIFLATLASLAGLRGHKDLLIERMKPPIQKDQPLADKVVLLWFLAAFYGLLIFIPIDVFRLHLLRRPNPVVSSLGLVLFAAGWFIVFLALRENAFAAPVIKHQEERRHTVVDTGAYRIVRHPMYAGFIPFLIGMPLWLGSYAGAFLAIVPIGVLVVRILIEERFLTQKLDGYAAYTHRVRYRLIPFLW